MRDIHHYLHGTVDTPETHIRGSARIDFAYGTNGVINSARKAGIGAYDNICFTDHRHLFVDIDLGELLSGYPPESAQRERRILESNNPRVVKTYMEKLEAIMKENDILGRTRRIRDKIAEAYSITQDDEYELNQIDEILTYARLEVERQCGKLSIDPYSPTLKKAMIIK